MATPRLGIIFTLSILLVFSSFAYANYIRMLTARSPNHVTKVILGCPTGAQFHRIVMGQSDQVTGNTTSSNSGVLLTFDLTPNAEGHYYCMINGIRTENTLELVANPTLNPVIRAQTVYSTPTGDDVTIHCPYKPGALLDRYSVEWLRGFSVIIPQNEGFTRHQILDNFSLVINNTVPDDAKAYSCRITVNISGDIVKAFAPPVSLEVTTPIRITQSISDVVVLPGDDAVFHCRAEGVPQPQIKWLIGTREAQGEENPVVSMNPNYLTVQSTLVRTDVTETDNGPVSCVAYHSYNGEVFLATSTANLVVLTNKFVVTLAPGTNGDVQLHATLPAMIPGVFSIIVWFIHNPKIKQKEEIIDPSFKNTETIDVSIPKNQLPNFNQFGIQIALKFDDKEGELTAETHKITLINEPPSTVTGGNCQCPEETGLVITQVLLAVFLVIVTGLLIVSTVLLMLCVCNIHKKGTPMESMISVASSSYFHDGESIKGDTLTRSVSRASYSSENSHSSGCTSRSSGSSTRSRHSSHSGSSRRSSHSTNYHGTWSHSDLESVREDVSIKHKEWGEKQKEQPVCQHELSSIPVSPDNPAAVPTDPDPETTTRSTIDEETTFQPPESREEVFHTSLPHASNPLQFTIKYEKKKIRHSDSSYEDMELDNSPQFYQPPFKTK